MRNFFYKYWVLYYILFFLLLGLLIYALLWTPDLSRYTNTINDLNNELKDCKKVVPPTIDNDSIRVINNDGEFGCLSYTLVWNSPDDLDLHVIDAKSSHIFYDKYCKSADNLFSSAGGQLDIDLNAGSVQAEQPVENVYFKCIPPKGNYIVKVHMFEKRTSNPVTFELIVRENGKIIKEVQGKLDTQKQLIEILNYKYDAKQ
ncbi:hypothetical protein [Flavobacterium sp.]|uniref:hypothetical protein n=1 Tax=Flavobacterium sp. TaxID=239 RepID=UPI00333FCFFD